MRVRTWPPHRYVAAAALKEGDRPTDMVGLVPARHAEQNRRRHGVRLVQGAANGAIPDHAFAFVAWDTP